MSEKLGLIKTTIRLVKKDEELINRILAAKAMGEEEHDQGDITEILRYNVWTTRQFSDLTGLAESTITNKCRPVYKDGEIKTELDHCYPFAYLGGLGPKFIVRNEKSEAMLPQPEPVADDAV